MLEKVFEIHPEVYKYSHSAYSQPIFLFYGNSVIKFCEGTQQGDPETPALFSDSIQDLIDSLESKINLWYLGDGILSDDYRIVLKYLEKIIEAERTLGLKIKPTKCEFFFSCDITEKRRSTILASFEKLSPRSKYQRNLNISFLIQRSVLKSQADLLEKKINELENVNGIVENLDAHYGFFMLKNCFSLPKLFYFLRTSTCLNHPALLEKQDKTVRDGLSKVCNVNFDDISSTQLALLDGWSFIRIIISTSRLFGLSFWCE